MHASVKNFVFHEFTWFAPADENLDNADSKIHAITPQHPVVDLFVYLVICGLFFVFTILSTNSSKNEISNYDRNNIEMISTALEEDPSSFWYSKMMRSTSCFHACGDGPSCNVVSKMQNIPRPVISNARVSLQSRISRYKACSNYVKRSQRTADRPVSQITSEWLIRRTRSGHIYGKYPI